LLERALSRNEDGEEEEEEEEEEMVALNGVLVDFARRLAHNAPPSVTDRLLAALRLFLDGCSAEQRMRLAGEVPGWEPYMEVRRATSAAHAILALADYAADPSRTEVEAIAALEDAAAALVGLLNGLLSLKKELRAGCAINAVAARMRGGAATTTTTTTLDGVVGEIEAEMRRLVRVFDEAAARLLGEAGEERRPAAQTYVDGCRAIVTGTLEFT
jgi:hypothetical protein